MHMLGFLAETMIPSRQQSSFELGWQHLGSGLQQGACSTHGLHGAGQAGAHGWQTGGHGSAQQGSQPQSREHPIQRTAVVNKKTNEVSSPSCFLIKFSF